MLWLVSLASSKRKSYLKEVKGLTNKLYAYALVWKKTGLHAKFEVHWSLVYRFLHGCGLHYTVLSGLSVKQEVKRVNDELHKCAPPRMKTGLLEFI